MRGKWAVLGPGVKSKSWNGEPGRARVGWQLPRAQASSSYSRFFLQERKQRKVLPFAKLQDTIHRWVMKLCVCVFVLKQKRMSGCILGDEGK